MTYNPDKWLIIKCPECYKVFGTWIGGYLDGDSWQINSGITSVETGDDYFLFHGESGSVYKCYMNQYGTTAYGASVLEDFTRRFGDKIVVIRDLNDAVEIFRNEFDID